MNELKNTCGDKHSRWSLLATVSAATLICATGAAVAQSDPDRPTVWIELGAQLERVGANSDVFAPPFLRNNADSPAFTPASPIETARAPRYSKGFEGKITFQPEKSDWSFAVAAIYGRANGNKHVHEQTAGISLPSSSIFYGFTPLPTAFDPLAVKNFSETTSRQRESHTVLDFQAGRDVGLGIFGRNSVSNVNFGVRYAQFSSKVDIDIKARPYIKFGKTEIPLGGGNYFTQTGIKYWNTYEARLQKTASFRGVGPSLSWNSSAVLAGTPEDGEVSFDWGVNAALLFGRQKTALDHSTTAHRAHVFAGNYTTEYAHDPKSSRSRSVTVPNIGGFAGLSMRYSAAKFSVGYRGDFFFGAMDTGIDTSHTTDRNFHGPFAKISIGFGG